MVEVGAQPGTWSDSGEDSSTVTSGNMVSELESVRMELEAHKFNLPLEWDGGVRVVSQKQECT